MTETWNVHTHAIFAFISARTHQNPTNSSSKESGRRTYLQVGLHARPSHTIPYTKASTIKGKRRRREQTNTIATRRRLMLLQPQRTRATSTHRLIKPSVHPLIHFQLCFHPESIHYDVQSHLDAVHIHRYLLWTGLFQYQLIDTGIINNEVASNCY